jgi:hypothetical protein
MKSQFDFQKYSQVGINGVEVELHSFLFSALDGMSG